METFDMLWNDINVSDGGDLIENYGFTSSCDPHGIISDPMEVYSFIEGIFISFHWINREYSNIFEVHV